MEFQIQRIASMRVRAGIDGVLQEMDLEEGQWVMSGQTLARVVVPERLKAELRIPQTQATNVARSGGAGWSGGGGCGLTT